MGILSALFEKRTYNPDDDYWYRPVGTYSSSGYEITESSALNYSAVYACNKVLSETVSTLPLKLFRRLPDDGKEPATNHPLYKVLHRQPHPYLTACQYKKSIVTQMGLWGNSYSYVMRDLLGGMQLVILPPNWTKAVVGEGGQLRYEYRPPGQTEPVVYRPEQIFHPRLFSIHGLTGLSPIGQAREAIGLGLAEEEFGARLYGNGVQFSGVLQHPGRLGDKALAHLKNSFDTEYAGVSNAWKVKILEEGMEWKPVSMPAKDAQFLESRKFQINEICRWYRIPPHMLQDLDRATFSNIEHQSLEFVMFTLAPWLVEIEQEITAKLLPEEDRDEYFAEFNVNGLLRGDIKTRYESYAQGRQWGWLSVNDIRRLENQNPVPDGDMRLVPMNMIPADQAGQDLAPPKDETKDLRRFDNADDAIRWLNEEDEYDTRSPNERRRVQAQYYDRIHGACKKVVARELSDVRNAIQEHISQRSAGDFQEWVEDYYQTFPGMVTQMMLPALMLMANPIIDVASKEVGADKPDEVDISAWVDTYAENMGLRHAISSRGQLRQIAQDTEPAELEEALVTRTNEWEEKRPDKMAMREVSQLANAAARWSFIVAGITKLIWVTYGDSCPICKRLNGRTVSIRKSFVSVGEDLGEGFVVKKEFRHPPAHEGCDCGVRSG